MRAKAGGVGSCQLQLETTGSSDVLVESTLRVAILCYFAIAAECPSRGRLGGRCFETTAADMARVREMLSSEARFGYAADMQQD